jgi:hypothetical protein
MPPLLLTRLRVSASRATRNLPFEAAACLVASLSLLVCIGLGHAAGWWLRVFTSAVLAAPCLFSLTMMRRADRGGRLHYCLAAALIAIGSLLLVWSISGASAQRFDDAFLWRYGPLLLAATALPFLAAAYSVPAAQREQAFASFVCQLTRGLLVVGLVWVAAIVAIGVITFALDELFRMRHLDRYSMQVIALVSGAAALALFHQILPGGREEPDALVQRWLVSLVAAPFVAVMLAIVAAYEFCVLVGSATPHNTLSPLIIAAGAAGFTCALAIQSSLARRRRLAALRREVGEAWESALSVNVVRALPLALLALAPMAMWALWVRVDDYGFTPFRVARLFALSCLIALGLLGTMRLLRKRGPLSWEIPLCVSLFSLAAGIGPLSTMAVSVRSQTQALRDHLDAIGFAGSHDCQTLRALDSSERERLYREMHGLEKVASRDQVETVAPRLTACLHELEVEPLSRMEPAHSHAVVRTNPVSLPAGRQLYFESNSASAYQDGPWTLYIGDGAAELRLREEVVARVSILNAVAGGSEAVADLPYLPFRASDGRALGGIQLWRTTVYEGTPERILQQVIGLWLLPDAEAVLKPEAAITP